MSDPTIESLIRSDRPEIVLLGIEKALTDRSIKCLDALLQHRDSPHPDVRRKSREAGSVLLIEYLISNFSRIQKDKIERYVSILKALIPNIGELLFNELKNPDLDNKSGRFQLLSFVDMELTLKVISGATWDNDPKLRSIAVRVLGQHKDPQNLSKVLKFLNDKDSRVITNTLETLESLGNQNLLGVVMRFRSHPNNRVRATALKILHTLGTKSLITDVTAMTESNNELMQASATWLVGQIGTQDALFLKPLEPLTASEYPIVRSNLLKTLRKTQSPETQKMLAKIALSEDIETEDKARERMHQIRLERDERTRSSAVKLLATLINTNDLTEI